MLNELFGGETTVKCLMYLTAMGEGYPLEISKAFKISNTQVTRTLNKLEQADILIGREAGRTRIYSLNERAFFAKELKALLNRILANMPIEDQEKYFMRRKAPRKKNKAKRPSKGKKRS
jgi:DNA-binding MarR family transcriptional regulator